MREKINKKVSVLMYYSSDKNLVRPYVICYRGKNYRVGKIGYHHKFKEGATLHHIFELIDEEESLWFRLNLNTDNLHWILEAIHDGNAY